jgi:hypothetical protein
MITVNFQHALYLGSFIPFVLLVKNFKELSIESVTLLIFIGGLLQEHHVASVP